jgi:two-component system response regulator FlrC
VIGAEHIQVEEGCRLWAVGCSQNEESNSDPPLATALSASISATERDLILTALRSANGNRQAVAKRLGISPRTLRYKLAKLREAGVEV